MHMETLIQYKKISLQSRKYAVFRVIIEGAENLVIVKLHCHQILNQVFTAF